MNGILSQLFTIRKIRIGNNIINWGLKSLARMSMENIEVSRVMMPDDANIAGNVHGGTILKMIEEAGVIIATRHCNQGILEFLNLKKFY